jgi:hypothetical protein
VRGLRRRRRENLLDRGGMDGRRDQCCHRRGAGVPGLLVLMALVALITLVCLACLAIRATVHFVTAKLRPTLWSVAQGPSLK